jgi:hypothetical protein
MTISNYAAHEACIRKLQRSIRTSVSALALRADAGMNRTGAGMSG